MKIAGIILLCLQGVALLSGGIPFNEGIFLLIGYFLPGIIGAILLWRGIKKDNS